MQIPDEDPIEIAGAVEGDSRLVVLLKAEVGSEQRIVRLVGPWRDPGDAHVEMEDVHAARGSGETLLLDWASFGAADVVVAVVEPRDPESGTSV